jgi:hypothetical protein
VGGPKCGNVRFEKLAGWIRPPVRSIPMNNATTSPATKPHENRLCVSSPLVYEQQAETRAPFAICHLALLCSCTVTFADAWWAWDTAECTAGNVA